MSIEKYTELMIIKGLTPEQQQYALAVFAYEYVEQTEQITDYTKFKTNDFEEFMN
mgnify:CR=1 FL=1